MLELLPSTSDFPIYWLRSNCARNAKRSIFQIFWKEHCCANFFFLKLATSDLHHRPNFDQGFWIWTQILPAQCTMGHNTWFVVAVLLLYRPKVLVIMLPFNHFYNSNTAATIQVLCLIVHCAGPFWVQNQNSWSKPGLLWRSEVANSKNKNLAQQCTFQKIWKILLYRIS